MPSEAGGRRAEMVDELVPGGEPILLLGDGLARWPEVILRAVPGGRPAPPALWTPRAALVAALGRERLLAGQRDDPHTLVPGYRPPPPPPPDPEGGPPAPKSPPCRGGT